MPIASRPAGATSSWKYRSHCEKAGESWPPWTGAREQHTEQPWQPSGQSLIGCRR
jgi:hypothetical protein